MTNPVSMQGQQNYSCYQPLKAGHFVVNPPVIRPHSFYDEIKVDKEFYNELINPKSKAFFHKPVAMKTQKPKNRLKRLLTWTAIIAGAIVCYAKRNLIKTFITNTYDKIKNHIKRK